MAMKTNPNLKVMLNGGLYDLATPYYEGIYEMRQLPIPRKLQANIEYKQYESGHMVYAHEQSLKGVARQRRRLHQAHEQREIGIDAKRAGFNRPFLFAVRRRRSRRTRLPQAGDHPKQPRYWTEYVATAAALVLSAVSLWVAVGTEDANVKMVDANRQMVSAASWPFLQIDSSNGDEGGNPIIELSLVNAGVGPAKIKSLEVFWRGKAYPSSKALLTACCIKTRIGSWSMSTSHVPDRVLRAGETSRFLKLDRRGLSNAPIWDAFDPVRYRQLSYQACYCSVFDECWIGDLTTLHQTRVSHCPIPKVPYVE